MLMVASIPLTGYKLLVNKWRCYKLEVAIVKTCIGLEQINLCNPDANLLSCIKLGFNLDFVDALACSRCSDGTM